MIFAGMILIWLGVAALYTFALGQAACGPMPRPDACGPYPQGESDSRAPYRLQPNCGTKMNFASRYNPMRCRCRPDEPGNERVGILPSGPI